MKSVFNKKNRLGKLLIEYENMLEDDNCIRELQCVVDYNAKI